MKLEFGRHSRIPIGLGRWWHYLYVSGNHYPSFSNHQHYHHQSDSVQWNIVCDCQYLRSVYPAPVSTSASRLQQPYWLTDTLTFFILYWPNSYLSFISNHKTSRPPQMYLNYHHTSISLLSYSDSYQFSLNSPHQSHSIHKEPNAKPPTLKFPPAAENIVVQFESKPFITTVQYLSLAN